MGGFCGYLDAEEMSAILLYPDIWHGSTDRDVASGGMRFWDRQHRLNSAHADARRQGFQPDEDVLVCPALQFDFEKVDRCDSKPSPRRDATRLALS